MTFSHRRTDKGFTLIEMVVVVSMIAVLMVASLSYYQKIQKEARVAGLKMLSSRFASVVSLLHVKWMINESPKTITLEDAVIIMSDRGWPVGARAPYITKGSGACQQLWEGLFKNPGALPRSFPEDESGTQYWTSRPHKGVCRFQLVTREENAFYFDYFSSSGRVKNSLN